MTFWIIIVVLAAIVALLLAIALLRTRDVGESAAAFDLRVYRDQLKEVDRDVARGVMSAEDAARSKSEIGRRVLAADTTLTADKLARTQPRTPAIVMTILTVGTVIGGSLWLYSAMGAPGYPDLSLKDRIAASQEFRVNRPSQTEAEARIPPRPSLENPDPEFLELMGRLRTAIAKRPDDLQGHRLLAHNEMALGNLKAAYAAQKRIIAIKGDAATATDYAEFGNMQILAADGYVSPEAETALRAALARNPQDGASQYYIGLMMSQIDRPDAAFRLWRKLLQRGPSDALWIAPIRAQIVEMSQRAGVEYDLPPEATLSAPATPDLSGPSQEDIANAQDMNDEDRQNMIRGMVSQLSERLASDGGSAAEWARLIGALGVLGDTDRAAAIFNEAQTVFADKPDDLSVIRSAAIRAGLSE